MKFKNAFTIIELLVVISIISILASIIIPVFSYGKMKKQRMNNKAQIEQVVSKFTEGDLVAIEGMDATGKVNVINHINGRFDILIRDENGKIQNIEGINGKLLRKVQTSLRD